MKTKKASLLTKLVVLALLIGAATGLLNLRQQILTAQSDLAEAEAQVAAQKQVNADLSDAVENSDDPDRQADIARGKLGLVEPGEYIFRFTDCKFMREDLAVSMECGVGSVLAGKVTGFTKFGAFVSLPEGKSGLVHISEIAYSYVNDVKDHLKEGQEVKVKVIGIDENGRINLSIKKAMDPPPRPAGQGRPMGRPGGHTGGGFRGKPAPAEPASFEDRLKQFMAASDSKLSELRQSERRSSRRGGRK